MKNLNEKKEEKLFLYFKFLQSTFYLNFGFHKFSYDLITEINANKNKSAFSDKNLEKIQNNVDFINELKENINYLNNNEERTLQYILSFFKKNNENVKIENIRKFDNFIPILYDYFINKENCENFFKLNSLKFES